MGDEMASSSRSRRPTMNDIAKELGVSQALVSLVFRNKPGVGEEMRKRILETAERIGYVRDESARSLRSQAPTAIGVTFRIHQPFHDEILDGLYRLTEGTPHNLVLSAISEDRDELTAVRDLLAHRCGSLILLGPRTRGDVLARLVRGTPMIVVAKRSEYEGTEWVMSDDDLGVSSAVEHLVELGHRRIVYLSSRLDAGGPERVQALFRVVARYEDRVEARVVEAGMTEEAGAAAVLELLRENDLPTAILAFNDRCAAGAMEVLFRQGIRVPEDVSVVGFDDSSVAARPSMDMTSIHQDAAELAKQAIERARSRMADPSAESIPEGGVVPTRLVVRSSTGAPRASSKAERFFRFR